jgi:hypothetical protein
MNQFKGGSLRQDTLKYLNTEAARQGQGIWGISGGFFVLLEENRKLTCTLEEALKYYTDGIHSVKAPTRTLSITPSRRFKQPHKRKYYRKPVNAPYVCI